jgi:L-aspartate oxidase
MTRDAGVERNRPGLERLLAEIDAVERSSGPALPVVAARLIAEAALAREESRGAHHRTDFPATRAEAEHTRVTLAAAPHPALAA